MFFPRTIGCMKYFVLFAALFSISFTTYGFTDAEWKVVTLNDFVEKVREAEKGVPRSEYKRLASPMRLLSYRGFNNIAIEFDRLRTLYPNAKWSYLAEALTRSVKNEAAATAAKAITVKSAEAVAATVGKKLAMKVLGIFTFGVEMTKETLELWTTVECGENAEENAQTTFTQMLKVLRRPDTGRQKDAEFCAVWKNAFGPNTKCESAPSRLDMCLDIASPQASALRAINASLGGLHANGQTHRDCYIPKISGSAAKSLQRLLIDYCKGPLEGPEVAASMGAATPHAQTTVHANDRTH